MRCLPSEAWNHPDFALYSDNGRTAHTRTLTSASAQLSAATSSSRDVKVAGSTLLRTLSAASEDSALPGLHEARG
eukprot:3236542-Amphidinium_carterae.1